jgi:hypothetical protein
MLVKLRNRLLLNGTLVAAGSIVDSELIPGRFFKAENVLRTDDRELFPVSHNRGRKML